MPHHKRSVLSSAPQTWKELEIWIKRHLQLSPGLDTSLLRAIEGVFARHERVWQGAKNDAVEALALKCAHKLSRARTELSAKETAIDIISREFERLVGDLAEKAHRDPKTKLMNFARFTERLETFLAFEQRGCWCMVGMVDIAGFKQYNDKFGHLVGDKIIAQVAQCLHDHVRSEDVLARETSDANWSLHGRFGGDEFCFMIADLAECEQAYAIAERFREAVERYDWHSIDHRLAAQGVRVDIGVVCLRVGGLEDRRSISADLAIRLIERADELMYRAKLGQTRGVACARAHVEHGRLIDVPDDECDTPTTSEHNTSRPPAAVVSGPLERSTANSD